MRYRLVLWPAVAERLDGDEEESIATLGLDFLQPYKSASNSWHMDAKAES